MAVDLVPDPDSVVTIGDSLIGSNDGNNLIAAPVGMPDGNGNLIGTGASPIDPMLGPLADNGGPTQTHALLPGSPAIDAGDPAIAFDAAEFDQRGGGFARVQFGRVDIGAYESETPDPSLFVVTTTNDELDFSNAGVSLREAITVANEVAGADTITFSTLFDTAQTIDLILGELEVTDELTIVGSGEDLITIDAGQNSRVVNFTASTGDLTLEGLTLTGGRTTGDNTNFSDTTHSGGGIRFVSGGMLALTNSTVSGNSTAGSSADGGGISALDGALTLTNSTVSGNSTAGFVAAGGGIYAYNGDVTLTDSTVSGNSTAGLAASGGGIYAVIGALTLTNSTVSGNSTAGNSADGGGIVAINGDLTLTNSTVSGNSTAGSSAEGGGIYANSGDLTLTNSTVSGNSTAGSFAEGGGIFAINGDLTLTNSTVSGNSTAGNSAEGGGIYASRGDLTLTNSTVSDNVSSGDGGGVFVPNSSFNPTLTIDNSIIAGNTANGMAVDLVPDPDSVVTIGDSLIGSNDGNNLIAAPVGMPDGNGNLIGTGASPIDPMLGPLADNGGPTQTHALLPGSPAIDAGDPAIAFDAAEFDQRGGGFARVQFGRVDIGAYESETPDPSLFVVTTTNDELDFSNAGVSLREAITVANEVAGADTITFSTLFDTAQTIDLILGELEVTDELTIVGSGEDLITIDAGQNSRVVNFTASTGDLTLEGLTLTGGRTTGDNTNFSDTTHSGGGIRFVSGGMLALTNSTVSGNSTAGSSADGGGISALDGALTLTNSTVSGNSTAGFVAAGGGIYAYNGDVTLTDSTVSGNSTAGLAASGGGIYAVIGALTLTNSTVSGNSTAGNSADGGGIVAINGDLTLTNSTVSGNSTAGSSAEGGGIYANSGDLTLTNSTVSGNSTAGSFAEGGGIFAINGDLTLTNSTVSGNSTAGNSAEGGGIYASRGDLTLTNSTVSDNVSSGDGGGVFVPNSSFNPTLTIDNSIIAGNTANGMAVDLVPDPDSVVTIGDSLIGSNDGNNLIAAPVGMPDGNGNLIGTGASPIDPMLGPLADNGGPTKTHALLPGSPALNSGSSTEPFDQRGAPFSRNDGNGVDIGAFESHELDFGDAPAGFPTARADNGAAHFPTGARLGASRDSEVDGVNSAGADADDQAGDDEDGVMFGTIGTGAVLAGVNVDVQNGTNAKVDAWLDFDGNGVWDSSEKILDDVPVVSGLQTLNFSVPGGAAIVAGNQAARVRISSVGGLDSTGTAVDGEVEDYLVNIVVGTPPKVESVAINGGDSQRSSINTVRVTFDQVVDITDINDAFEFTRVGNLDPIVDIPVQDDTSGKTVVDITFTPGANVNASGGLINGDYQLSIDSSKITYQFVRLDGDDDGNPGGNHVFGDQAADNFFRKYGDTNGNNTVDLLDFAAFRQTFGQSSGDAGYVAELDADLDNTIGLLDFAQFRQVFGT